MKMKCNFKVLRAKKRMTQADLAEKSGVSRTTIVNLERNPEIAKVSTLLKLAAALDCSVADFFVG